LKAKATSAFSRVFLRSLPMVRAKNKRERILPALVWHFLGSTMGLMQHLVPLAFAPLHSQLAVPGPVGTAGAPTEGLAYVQDIAWHKVQGQRYHSFVRGLENLKRQQLLRVQCLVLEPLAFVTSELLKWSSHSRRLAQQRQGLPNLIQCLATPSRSPFLVALQHLSALARGDAARPCASRKEGAGDAGLVLLRLAAGLVRAPTPCQCLARCRCCFVFRLSPALVDSRWLLLGWVGVTCLHGGWVVG
jgi:hypothetical protein